MSVERELLAEWAAGYALSGSGLARVPVSRPLTAAANWLADASADELVGSMGVPSPRRAAHSAMSSPPSSACIAWSTASSSASSS